MSEGKLQEHNFPQVISYTHCPLFLNIKYFLTTYNIRAKTNLFYGNN